MAPHRKTRLMSHVCSDTSPIRALTEEDLREVGRSAKIEALWEPSSLEGKEENHNYENLKREM